MGTSHQKARRRKTIGEPSTGDLDGWEFGPPGETTALAPNTPSEAARTDSGIRTRSESELAGWTFGVTDGHRDRPAVVTEPTDATAAADVDGVGSGTVSSLEARLAPIVGALVVLSLLLGGGYIFAVTVW